MLQIEIPVYPVYSRQNLLMFPEKNICKTLIFLARVQVYSGLFTYQRLTKVAKYANITVIWIKFAPEIVSFICFAC